MSFDITKFNKALEDELKNLTQAGNDIEDKDSATNTIPTFFSNYDKKEGAREDKMKGELATKHMGVLSPEAQDEERDRVAESTRLYSEELEDASKDVLRSQLNRAGVSVFNFDKFMKEGAKQANMQTWDKAKRIADARATTTSAEDIDKGMQSVLAQRKKNDLLDTESILNSIRAKDEEGNEYFGFNGKRLYGDDMARNIVNEYVDEHNHWINMRDKEYRENWSMQTFGIPYEEHVGKVYEENLAPQWAKVQEAAEKYYKSIDMSPEDFARMAMINDGAATRDLVGEELGNLRNATNSFIDASFVNGIIEGAFPAIQTLTSDFGSITVPIEQAMALKKAYRGEELNAKENLLVEMFKYEEALNEEKGKFRKGWNAADVGSGVIQGFGYMGNMLLESAALGGAIIKKGLEKGVVEAFKEGAETSIKEGLKQGARQGLKNMGYGLIDDSLRAPLNVTTYQEFADRQKGKFHMTDMGLIYEPSNPLGTIYQAYATMFTERGSERLGDFIDDGIRMIGASVARNKWIDAKFGKIISRASEFKPSAAVLGGLRGARIQGLAGEYISERVNEYMTPFLTGEYFTTLAEDGRMAAYNKHFADVLTSESALSTLAICGALAGVGTVARGVSGAKAGVEIASLRNKTKDAIAKISNESLRNDVFTAISTNDYSNLSKADWQHTKVADARLAMEAVFNSAKVQNMRGELNEMERLNTFKPVLDHALESCYLGVDMATPTPSTDVVQLFNKEGGYIGNVIYGNLEDKNSILTIKSASGKVEQVSMSALAEAGFQTKQMDMGDFVAEQYALMFGTSIAKERLDEVIANVRGFNKMSDEAKEKVIAENGFSVYGVGTEVTLADGRQAIVAENANNGTYNVEVADDKGNRVLLNVGFEYILNETDSAMAQAQMEAMAEGAMEPPVALPTDKDGNIKLNDINDSKTLALVMPSQMGGKQKAIEAIDTEIARLKAEAEQGTKTEQTGLDAIAEAQKSAEARDNRIKILEDARKELGGADVVQPKTAEEVKAERDTIQAERDAMSTFDFSRDFRQRTGTNATSAQVLQKFVANAVNAVELAKVKVENLNEQIAEKETELENAYSTATSEADMERIAEETKGLQQEIDALKDERKKSEDAVAIFNHRKAQYEQTLKDMGVKERKTLGENKKLRSIIEKANKTLGLPIVMGDAKDFPVGGNAKHVVRDGKNLIVVNPNATDFGSGVGILAHEIGHEFKQFLKPEDWAKFEDLVNTARFGADWRTNDLYKQELKDITDAEIKVRGLKGEAAETFRESFKEKAIEEAVTYGIEYLIFDGKKGIRAFEAILRNHDKGKSLMDKFKTIWDRVRKFFSFFSDDTEVNEAIAEFDRIFTEYISKDGKSQKSGEIKAEQIEGETAAIINEKEGQSSFSLSTYEDGGRDILQDFLTSQVEGGKLDQKDANAILTEMDAIYDICMDYKDEYAPFGAWSEAAVVRDGEGIPVFSVIKANGDYAMNLDFSLVCKKRRTLDAVLNEMIGRKLIEIAPDDPTFIVKVNDIVRKYGFETAFRLCFVDAKRFRVVSTARNFCKLYNGVVAKLMPTNKKVAINSFDAAGVGYPIHEGSLDTLADSELNIKALEDILKRNGEKTVIAKIARHLLEHPEDRKLVHISDFVSTRGFDPTKALNPQILSLYNSKKGAGGPKASSSDVQYLNDVIYADWNKEDAYAVGGVRVQSFSDYVPRMVFDYMQMVADLAAKQMPVHAYTKEAAFAKTFGLTGMKINMSLVPTVVEGGVAAGLDADGNYAWEEGETFDYDTAIEIQNADGYRENCGTIAVGVSDEHIDKMLDDDNIRMVIPYHKSGLNKAVAIANNIDAFKDYTNQQSTRYADGTKLSSADSKNVPNFNEDTRRLGDPRKAADAYLAWCKENNYKPKFDKWASHPNYYKLLEDFTTLVDGEYFEQSGVTMTFPKDGDAFGSLSNLIAESLEEDAVLEGKRDSLVGAMVDEIESTLFSNREKALESSNSLQKQPNTQEVVTDADVVEESFSISRNNEATIDKWLGKREDFTDEVKKAFKEYIADFKPATQLATTKWYANGVIRIPEDMPKVEQAMEIAQRKKVDALQYNSPMELIEQFGVVAPKEKLINPDDVPTLSNKTQVPNTDITIYDVDDSEESRKNFRELMNSHLGKESSPWCLLQADKNGVLTTESARYWKHYNRYPKRAAFNNGKLIAFFASDGEPTWWDRMDQPHSEIPVVGKIKGDVLGRTATMLVSENGEVVGYTDIHKGNKIDGLYEEWYDLEHINRRGTFKNAQREGIFEQWHSNGVRQSYVEFKNDMEHRLSEQWDYDGELIKRRVSSEDAQIIGLMYKSPLTHAKERLALTNFDKPNTISMIWNGLTGVPARIENNLPDGVERWDMYDWSQLYINTKTQKQYDWTKLEFISHNGGYGISDYTSTSMSESVEFEDGVKYEKKNRGFDRYISDIYNLEVGEKTFIATISTDGEHKKISISRKIDTRYAPFATIEDGKRSMPMGIKDTEVDAVLAEVENRLDAINKMALDVQEDAKREKARAEKIREKFNSKNIPDIETVEDVDKMLEKINSDLASTKDSFSIDRSQYLEDIKDEEYRDWTRGKLFQIEEAVKNGLDVRLGQTISTYDKYAKKEERKAKRAKTDWDRNNAEQKVASYRAITEYGRAMMKEYFPEFIANAHADNIKSGNATLSYIEELFNKYNKNEDTAELFKVVMKTARQIGTKARFETLRDGSRLGEQRANLIKYDVDAMNSDTISDESKATTLLHELIHAVTSSGILLVEQPSLMVRTGITPSKQLTTAVRRLKRTFDSIKKDDAFKGTYGSTSYEEMLAELANPKFAEKLKAHDIWVRVVNGIREVVLAIASIVTGKDYKTSAYAELRDTLTEIIEETPMEFVGFINVVRDETIAKNYMEVESVEEIASLAESEGTTSFSLVRDEAKIAELEASPKRIGYRNVILNEDGSFSSPMATHIGNTGKGKVKSTTFNLGEWEEAEENPQLVDEQGKVYIYKDNGGSVHVAYDPYIHNRLDKVNAQFKEAWKRPNLVYVETEVPITDLESGYHADKAKLPVGVHPWSNGDLMLSRYDKPIRIVSWEEVADDWVARFKDRGVEFDIVPPALLPILKERGVEILPPHKGLGADATEAYETSRGEQESFSILREEDTDTIFATAKEEFASTNDWLKTGWLMPDGTQLDFAEGGDYRGTDHRAIGAAYKGVAEHQWQYLQDFESRGGIRIHMNRDGKYGTIEMTIKPTAEQKKRLRSFIGAVGGNVDVDFMDENYNTAHSASYEGVSPARVLSGITNFYDEGIKPKGNVSYSVARLPKAEYGRLSSIIMTRQHTYHRPPFDYAYTSGKFYVYDYLGDGDFIIKFALPIVEEYKEAINLISKAIDNGTINSTRSLDTFLETTRSGKGDDIIDLVDVLKERAWYQGVSTPMSSRQGRKARGVSNVGNSDSTTTSSRGESRRSVSLENSTEESYSLSRNDIDYLDAVNRGDIETESFSLNRDEITVATPEMVAEANEELSREMELIEQLDEAQTALDRLRSKIDKRNQRKELTFDEVRKFLLDGDTLQGLQKASAGQYKRIITNVLNTLEKTPEKRIAINKLVDKVQEALTSARLNVANSNLKAVGKDFANVIKKKREGKNSRGEVIAKYVDDTTRKIMQEFSYAVSALFTTDDKVDWKNILAIGVKDASAIDAKIVELEDAYSNKPDAVTLGTINLLKTFKDVWARANDVHAYLQEQRDITVDRAFVDERIAILEALIEKYESGQKGFGDALREIRSMGYRTIKKAKTAVDNFKAINETRTKEMRSAKQKEADAKGKLVDVVRDMNTAIQSVDKQGRIALKEANAKRKEEELAFRKGIFRSTRNRLYENVATKEQQKNGEALTRREKAALTRRGTAVDYTFVDSFEYQARKMDVMSIPNEWLEYGFYYQFMLHPQSGIMARMDWRYKTEKALRDRLNEKAKEILGIDKKRWTISDLKNALNAETGITRTVVHTKLNGEVVPGASPSTINFTVQQLLYIRAMLKQDNGIAGYLSLGLTADDVQQIVNYTETTYPKFCELADWVMGKDGILEEIYALRNPIYKKLNGVDLDHTSEYFPIKRLKGVLPSAGQSVGEQINTSQIAGGIGSNKKRIRNSAPMDINVGFFEVLEQHINESMRWCASAELIHKMNVLLGSPAFIKMLKAQGVDIQVFKDGFLRAIGEDMGASSKKHWITYMAQNAVASNVVLNLNSALKQFLSGTAILSQEISPKLWGKTIKALIPAIASNGFERVFNDGSIDSANLPLFLENLKWAKENIPTFAERADSGTMGYDIFADKVLDNWWTRMTSKLVEWGMSPNVFIDLLTCSTIGKAYYDYQYEINIKRGLLHEDAHADACTRAAVLINQTQQSSLGAFLSSRQKDKSGDVVSQLWNTALTAYQNSQMAFDRNARAAILNIYSMVFDDKYTHAKRDMIRYKAEEYISRGMSERDAENRAKADFRKSLWAQFNTLLHNLVLNSTLWVVVGSNLGAYVSAMLTALLRWGDEDEYNEVSTNIAWDKLREDTKWKLAQSLVYLLPISSHPLVKPILEGIGSGIVRALKGEGKGVISQSRSVSGQPISDVMNAGDKWFTAKMTGKTEEEIDDLRTAFWLITADAAARYGLGFSARTLTRMAEGVLGGIDNGDKAERMNIEDRMNYLSSPRSATKLFVERIRKDETMDEYAERVGGAYKLINGRNKGEDKRKLRKQYTDRMDEIMFYRTDFDYATFKEAEKEIKRRATQLTISATYNPDTDKFSYHVKDSKAEEHSTFSQEEIKRQKYLAERVALVNALKRRLEAPANLNWDEDGAAKRRKYMRKEQQFINEFNNVYHNKQ